MPNKPEAAVDIESNLRDVERRIAGACQVVGRSPSDITLIGVTKTVEPSAIRLAFRAGLRHFGENRVQEAEKKVGQLADLVPPPSWHMIGHLQANKARLAVTLFDTIHSADSIKLAEKLSLFTPKNMAVLLQVNLSGRTYGFLPEELPVSLDAVSRMAHLEVLGLMTIAPPAAGKEESRPFFRRLRLLGGSLGLKHLSMGMTDDFEVAIQEGATMLRIGRAIFGERSK